MNLGGLVTFPLQPKEIFDKKFPYARAREYAFGSNEDAWNKCKKHCFTNYDECPIYKLVQQKKRKRNEKERKAMINKQRKRAQKQFSPLDSDTKSYR